MSKELERIKHRRDVMIDKGELSSDVWYALDNVFPGASLEAKVMVLEYCKARKLDPLKKVVHIVPIKGNDGKLHDVVMPGISELRTTAFRTKEYAGWDKPFYGAKEFKYGVEAPEFVEVTVYRMIEGQRVPFYGRADFVEACGTRFDTQKKIKVANRMWAQRPRQMLLKCAEADALRRAFPEELGGEYGFEEYKDDQHVEFNQHEDSKALKNVWSEAKQAEMFAKQQESSNQQWPVVGPRKSENGEFMPAADQQKEAIKDVLPPGHAEFVESIEKVEQTAQELDLGAGMAGELNQENQQKRKRARKRKTLEDGTPYYEENSGSTRKPDKAPER